MTDDACRSIRAGLRSGGPGLAVVPGGALPSPAMDALARSAWDHVGRYRIVERPGVETDAAPFPVEALIEHARWFDARVVHALASLGERVALQYVELRIEDHDAPPDSMHFDANYLTATLTVYGGEEGSAAYRSGGRLARAPRGSWLLFNGLHRRRFDWYRRWARGGRHPTIQHMRGHGRRIVLVARWEPVSPFYRWWRRLETNLAGPLRRRIVRGARALGRTRRRTGRAAAARPDGGARGARPRRARR